MSRENITRQVVTCKVCGANFCPDMGDVCRCPPKTDAEKQADWHDKLTEGDCYGD